MTAYLGPSFRLVDEVPWEELARDRRTGPRSKPLLIKGAVKAWPAWDRWSFDRLADLRRPDGSDVVFRFQNGLVEQGVTRPPLDLPISPYLRELAAATRAARDPGKGLLSDRRRAGIAPGDEFR